MAYFPDKQKIQQEIQENVNEMDLSCDHLTTSNFFEPNVGYYRHNTTREDWTNDSGVFARPLPLQLPVMGKADLKLKTYFVPYRTLSAQWHNFITRSPHVPANGTQPIIIQEMPYFKMNSLVNLFTQTAYSTVTTGTNFDFRISGGTKYIWTAKGRHCKKILNQLGYQIIWGDKAQAQQEHINALGLLAFAKVYLDYYYSSQYVFVTQEAYDVEQIFKRDGATAYELTTTDLENIFNLTAKVWYTEDYFVSQWDTPTSPNQITTTFGNIIMQDITTSSNDNIDGWGSTQVVYNANTNEFGTPRAYIGIENMQAPDTGFLTQYVLDSLKACTDYVRRYSMAGVRAIDRYLARFGVLLTSEKLMRSEYWGEQKTSMQFGAVMSTAETTNANVGDYAGQGIINSDGQEHNHFELNDIKDLGVVLQIFTIIPKIGYFQGIDRNNLRTDPESYFNGIYDSLGTQATSQAEVYISNDGAGSYSNNAMITNIFGYIARQAHMKVGRDNLTGDFTVPSLNNWDLKSPWHLFRVFDDNYFQNIPGAVTHSPQFCQAATDGEQYLRIFNQTEEDSADHFNVLLQSKVSARLHAKALYDTYDFEGEGKKIIMDGLGPKQN